MESFTFLLHPISLSSLSATLHLISSQCFNLVHLLFLFIALRICEGTCLQFHALISHKWFEQMSVTQTIFICFAMFLDGEMCLLTVLVTNNLDWIPISVKPLTFSGTLGGFCPYVSVFIRIRLLCFKGVNDWLECVSMQMRIGILLLLSHSIWFFP